jgi:hypothetical protein
MTADMLVTLEHKRRESPRSFLARLASANRVFPLLADVLDCPAKSATLLVDEPQNRGTTINWDNKKTVGFPALSAVPTPADINGAQMGISLFRSTFRPVCPQCLIENEGTTLFLWEFKRIHGCATHGCALLENCPACGKKVMWRHPLLRRCWCGFDLALAPTAQLASSSQSFIALFDEMVNVKPGARRLRGSGGLEYVASLPLNRFQLILEVVEEVLTPMFCGAALHEFVKKHGQVYVDSVVLDILSEPDFVVSLQDAIESRARYDPSREGERLATGQDPGQLASWYEPALRNLPRINALKHVGRLKYPLRWCNFSWRFKRGNQANEQYSPLLWRGKGKRCSQLTE